MSNHNQDVVALAYDKRGRLLSVGKNSYVKTHPLQLKYARRTGNSSKIYLHAELAALIKARTHIHKLVILRTLRNGEYGNAAPCPSCSLAIKEFNVDIVEHS